MRLKLIVTGSTGMVGEGVLHECLHHNDVEQVLVINRRPCGVVHAKLKEIIHGDFFNLSAIENQLSGYDGCFFCLGVSSVGMKKDVYYEMTYTLTMYVATTLSKYNPGMVFCYVSGASTDSSEKGKVHWARVKGKTENDLMKLPFKRAYAFRPGIMTATKGSKNTPGLYKWLGWLMIPIVRLISPKAILSLKQVGIAMINAVKKGYDKQVLEVSDIRKLSES
jgi:uncharacterized protein YbjT (DUF2867 family)